METGELPQCDCVLRAEAEEYRSGARELGGWEAMKERLNLK